MKVLLVGTGEDARGFALAGVAVRACETAADAAAALSAARDPDAEVGLVLVTPGVAQRAPEAVRAFLRSTPPPALLVLPGRRESAP